MEKALEDNTKTKSKSLTHSQSVQAVSLSAGPSDNRGTKGTGDLCYRRKADKLLQLGYAQPLRLNHFGHIREDLS